MVKNLKEESKTVNPIISVRSRVSIPKVGCEESIRCLKESHTYPNPEYAAAKARSRWGVPKRIPETIESWRDEGDVVSFPRGSLERIQDVLAGDHVTFEIEEAECHGSPEFQRQLDANPMGFKMQLRGFQEDQVASGLQHPTSLWRAPAGSGKTVGSYRYISHLNRPTIVVTPTAKIFQQWIRRAETELGMAPEDVGALGGGIKKVRPLTIALQQTLKNCISDYAELFGVYVADEVQRHASTTFSAVSDMMPAYHRLGVSADERRADGKEFLIYDLFGPVRHEVQRSELIADGYIHDAEIRVIPTDVELPWYSAIKGIKRASAPVQNRLHTELANHAARNDLITQVLRWCMDAGEQTLLMAWRVEHCHMLNSLAVRAGYRCGLMLGGDDQLDEFERSRLAMEAGELQVASGTYQAVGVGFDLPALSRGIMAAPCANNEKARPQFGQFVGRFERISLDTNKTKAVIYYVWDRKVFGERPLRNLLKWRSNVRVLRGNSWVQGRRYLKESKVTDDDLGSMFG